MIGGGNSTFTMGSCAVGQSEGKLDVHNDIIIIGRCGGLTSTMKIIAGASWGYSTSETTSLAPLGEGRGDSTSTTKIIAPGQWE